MPICDFGIRKTPDSRLKTPENCHSERSDESLTSLRAQRGNLSSQIDIRQSAILTARYTPYAER
jgi:hypothetical protein